MSHGTVKWFNPDESFGFIIPDNHGDDVFVHQSSLLPSGPASLHQHQRVEFDAFPGPHGPMAQNVRVVVLRETGTVKWFDTREQFGFITPDNHGDDVFVHQSALLATAPAPLQQHQRVEFDTVPGPRGPMAENVRLIGADVTATRPSDDRPPLQYEGRECRLSVYGDSILIEHKSPRTTYLPVSLARLSAVHFEDATRWTSGIITIATDGEPLRIPTGTQVGGDPNTIVFQAKSSEVFRGVYAWLERVVASNRS